MNTGRSDLTRPRFHPGRRQHALEADHEEVTDQVGVDVLGAAAHVILFKARDPFADVGFDFSLCFHGDLERPLFSVGGPHGRKPARPDRTGTHGYWAVQGYDTKRGTTTHLLSPC